MILGQSLACSIHQCRCNGLITPTYHQAQAFLISMCVLRRIWMAYLVAVLRLITRVWVQGREEG